MKSDIQRAERWVDKMAVVMVEPTVDMSVDLMAESMAIQSVEKTV